LDQAQIGKTQRPSQEAVAECLTATAHQEITNAVINAHWAPKGDGLALTLLDPF
jgi:hypothetical protein